MDAIVVHGGHGGETSSPVTQPARWLEDDPLFNAGLERSRRARW